MRRLPAFVALALVACTFAAYAQTDSVASGSRGVAATDAASQPRQGHRYIAVIGIDHYEHWPVLETAVSDATGFAGLLTQRFGFEYAADPLTEKNATRAGIDALIDDELRSKLKPEDDLILFFAGHGTTRVDRVGSGTQTMGFLVPYEARAAGADEHWSDYLDIEEFLRTVSTLPPQHILVILDSCHSGVALGSRFNPSRGDVRFQQDLTQRVSRTVIASAGSDQLAADVGPVPNHSLFTGLMMQGLLTGEADSYGQGFVTANQLGAYAQHAVGVAAGSKQTPRFGGFDLDDGGDLIIPLDAARAKDGAEPAGSSAAGPAHLPALSAAMAAAPNEIDVDKGKILYGAPFTFQQALAMAKYFKDQDDAFDDPGALMVLRKDTGVTEIVMRVMDEASVQELGEGSDDSTLIWAARDVAPMIGGFPIKFTVVNKAGEAIRQLGVTPVQGLYGTVTDASGAVIPNANVQATNEANGNLEEISTSGDGRFDFSDLAPGKYTLQVKSTGFKTYRQSALVVSEHGNTKADVVMSVGVD